MSLLFRPTMYDFQFRCMFNFLMYTGLTVSPGYTLGVENVGLSDQQNFPTHTIEHWLIVYLIIRILPINTTVYIIY